jgi:hypothetical protein
VGGGLEQRVAIVGHTDLPPEVSRHHGPLRSDQLIREDRGDLHV